MIPGDRLGHTFYQRSDVTNLAQDLLGMVLCTHLDGHHTCGVIVETEAYMAPEDKASHAYGGRRTARTETMFNPGGLAYVYLCYGIHHLFNVVTGPGEVPHAILIRGIEPVVGEEIMLKRRTMTEVKPRLTSGPGSLSRALGISTVLNGVDLTAKDSPIWIETPKNEKEADFDIIASPRVGVDYAEECAAWPWRYRIAGNPWASPAK